MTKALEYNTVCSGHCFRSFCEHHSQQ